MLEKNIFGLYKRQKYRLENYLIIALILTGIILTLYFFVTVPTKFDQMSYATISSLLSGFAHFYTISFDLWLKLIQGMFVSIAIAIVVTIISAVVGLLLGLLSSRNLNKGWITTTIRSVAGIIRAIPTIIWVLIFIPGYGLTATTAIVGMLAHSVAFFIKAFAESFEEVDNGVVEAITATGASKIKVAFGAIIPASTSKIISWSAIRFETNLAVAIVIGPAVGVPGSIGTFISAFQRGREWPGVGAALILIFIFTFTIEILIERVRKRYANN